MKIFALVLILLLSVGCALGNTPPTSPIVLVIDGKEVVLGEVSFSPMGAILLTGLCNGDLALMGAKLGAKTSALDALSPDIIKNIEDYARTHSYSAQSASISWTDKKYSFTKEKDGLFVDADSIVESIQYVDGRLVGEVLLTVTKAPLTLDEIKTWTDKTATFSTTYHTSSTARRHNIALATSSLDGYVLRRGATLSFNAVVGKRTIERGYKDANVIVQGEFTKGIGGGVCQVSTTLYNLAINCGLTVVSSACHSLPVSYVPLGRDAMVSENTDLIIKNDTEADVFLEAEAIDGVLTMTAYSKKTPLNQNIRITTNTDKVIEATYKTTVVDSLPDGATQKIAKEKRDGAIVSTYAEYIIDGKKTTKKLRTSYYKPTDGIVEKVTPNLDSQKEPTDNAGHIVCFSA